MWAGGTTHFNSIHVNKVHVDFAPFRLHKARLKEIFGEVPVLVDAGAALLLFYNVGAIALCNYIPQIIFSNVF